MIWAKDRPEVLAVLDWELSTLGDPLGVLLCRDGLGDH